MLGDTILHNVFSAFILEKEAFDVKQYFEDNENKIDIDTNCHHIILRVMSTS